MQCTYATLSKAFFYLKSNPQAQRQDLLENFLLWALESDPKTFSATERIIYNKKQKWLSNMWCRLHKSLKEVWKRIPDTDLPQFWVGQLMSLDVRILQTFLFSPMLQLHKMWSRYKYTCVIQYFYAGFFWPKVWRLTEALSVKSIEFFANPWVYLAKLLSFSWNFT